jgi:hypothetical protein
MSEKTKKIMIGIIYYTIIGCALIGLLIVTGCLFYSVFTASKAETREYELSKLNIEYYGIYTSVHSNVPANNYETVILRCNDQVLTLDGDVNIWYVDSDYKVIWKDTNLVHGDEIDIYVPEGSIEFYHDVGISR